MGLFSTMDPAGMSAGTVQSLIAVCDGMLHEDAAEHHRPDYQEFRDRLTAELRRRESAAVPLQAAVRGFLARREAEIERKRLQDERETKAALVIQQAFRAHAAREALDALREQQRLKIEEQLRQQALAEAEARARAEAQAKAQLEHERADRLAKADATLRARKIDPAVVVDAAVREELGRLAALYEEAEGKRNALPAGKRNLQSGPAGAANRAFQKASGELEAQLTIIRQLVERAEEERHKADVAARAVKLPPDFHQIGALVDCGSFLYPGAGYLKIGAKLYRFHPNRSLVHVKHELSPAAPLARAQAYLESMLDAARELIVEQKHADANVMSGWIRKRRRTPEGMAFDWSFQYKRIHPEKEGYAGSIEHVDSGYERSVWLPDGERGRCRKCGKHLAPRESHYGKSCA